MTEFYIDVHHQEVYHSLMKKIILVGCLSFSLCNFTASAESEDGQIDLYIQDGDYKQAVSFLLREMEQEETQEAFRKLLALNERLAVVLMEEVKYTGTLKFDTPMNKEAGKILGWGTILFGGNPIAAVAAEQAVAHTIDVDALRRMCCPRRIVPEYEARRQLALFDVLKDSLVGMENTLCKLLSHPLSPDACELYRSIKRDVERQKDRVRELRTDYLSYTVMSPRIWEATRNIAMADGMVTTWSDEYDECLEKAAVLLAGSCSNDTLKEAEKDVRAQYLEAVRYLKNEAGETLFSKLKNKTLLTDSADNNQRMGGERWLP